MTKYISINIQKCPNISQSFAHNLRFYRPDYLVDDTKNHNIAYVDGIKNLTTRSQIDEYQNELTKIIHEDYKAAHGQKMQAKTVLFHEAVIAFGRDNFEKNTPKDIDKYITKFVQQIEKQYKIKVLSHSLHLDEGNKTETGEILKNYHAHIIFVNYNVKTHKTCLRKIDYRKLHTELAECFDPLGFERGKNYKEINDNERKTAKLENREPELVPVPHHVKHSEYRKKQQELTEKARAEKLKLREDIEKLQAKKTAELENLAKTKETRRNIFNESVLQAKEAALELKSLTKVRDDTIKEIAALKRSKNDIKKPKPDISIEQLKQSLYLMKLNTITDENEAYIFALDAKTKTEEVWQEFEYYYSIKKGKNKGLNEIVQEYQKNLIEWQNKQDQGTEIIQIQEQIE